MNDNSIEYKQRTTSLKHDKYTLVYALSRLFERFGFYGLRAIIVLYMVSDPLSLSDVDTINIYSLFGTSIIISPIAGAILGDLLIGNKKAMLFGGLFQFLGIFALCLYSISGLYVGLIFITIGSGLYSPNLIAHFGKLYLTKTKLLDAAYTILYIAVNIGSLIGVLFIGFVAHNYGFRVGFIVSGLSYLIAFSFPLVLKERKVLKAYTQNFLLNTKVIVILLLAFFLTATYWGVYDSLGYTFNSIKSKMISIKTLNIPEAIWFSIETIFILPISILLAIVWSYVYSNQFIKLTIGFIFATLALWLFYLIPEFPKEENISLYLIAVILLVISELFISPIIHSVLTQYSNPKYLAIFISIASALYKAVYVFIGIIFGNQLIEDSALGLNFGTIIFCSISIGLVIFIFSSKKLKLDS
jgi:POT family proton-dependent oligopeptide transporter